MWRRSYRSDAGVVVHRLEQYATPTIERGADLFRCFGDGPSQGRNTAAQGVHFVDQ